MRWKLVLLTSLAAALLACGLWYLVAIALFGSAAALARSDSVLLASLAVPLAMTVIASYFVYRHTSRRRKTQASITIVASLLLTVAAYVVTSGLSPKYLYVPRTYDVRHAR